MRDLREAGKTAIVLEAVGRAPADRRLELLLDSYRRDGIAYDF